VAVRVLVVVFAIAVIVLGVTRLHAQHRCDDAGQTLKVALLLNRQPAGGLDATLKQMTDNCHENAPIEGTSLAMTARGERARAIALANFLIHRAPDSQDGYVALAEALPARDPRRAAVVKRLHVLNPRAVLPPVPRARPLRPSS